MANLRRQIRKPRFVIGNKGVFGKLQPFHKEFVFAGETQKSIKAQLNFMSQPIGLAQSGATIDVWFYYVPLPVIWSDFPTWVMGDSALSVPSTNKSLGDSLWGIGPYDDGGVVDPLAHFAHEAYVSIVNNFFRDDENQITSASAPVSLPIVDRSAETSGDVDLDTEDETIDVSSGTLSLKELERKRANLRYERRVEMMDGKYINWLKAQGVSANEALVDIPEFLGHYRRYVKPQRTVDQSTGFTVQHYAHDCTINLTKRRYFQEAGMIIGLYAIRPKIHIVGGFDTTDFIFASPQQFPQVGQLAEHKTIMTASGLNRAGYENTASAGGTYMSMDANLFMGRHEAYNPVDGYIKTHSPTSDTDAMYPQTAWDAIQTTTEHDYSVDGVMSTTLVTPLQKLLPA